MIKNKKQTDDIQNILITEELKHTLVKLYIPKGSVDQNKLKALLSLYISTVTMEDTDDEMFAEILRIYEDEEPRDIKLHLISNVVNAIKNTGQLWYLKEMPTLRNDIEELKKIMNDIVENEKEAITRRLKVKLAKNNKKDKEVIPLNKR